MMEYSSTMPTTDAPTNATASSLIRAPLMTAASDFRGGSGTVVSLVVAAPVLRVASLLTVVLDISRSGVRPDIATSRFSDVGSGGTVVRLRAGGGSVPRCSLP